MRGRTLGWPAIGTLVAVLLACGDDAGDPTETPGPAASPTATTAPAATTPIPQTPSPTVVVPGDPPGMLLVDYGERDGWESGSPGAARGALVALDPVSGAELAWWPPLNSGQASSGVPSPDGRLLAWNWHETQSSGSVLSIIEPATRKVRFTLEEPGVGGIVWSPDSRTIYGIKEDLRPLSAGAAFLGATLWAVDATTGEARESATIDFQVARLEVSDTGTLVGLAFDSGMCCGIDVEGDPFVLTIDPASGEVGEPIAVPGVVLGQRFEQPEGVATEINMLRYPDMVVSPDGTTAYIAHADDDGVTVVDLRAGEARTITPERSRSLLGRLGSWFGGIFVSEASAKGGAYFMRQVELSPDGRSLYITGTRSEFCEGDDWFACMENVPAGLRIIDTGSMQVVAEQEGIGEIAFTADGSRVLGWALAFDYRGKGDRAELVPYGPYVLDSTTHELIAEAATPLGGRLVPSTDPRYAFTGLEGPGRQASLTNGGQCVEACTVIAVIDVETATVVGRHEYRGYLSMQSLIPAR